MLSDPRVERLAEILVHHSTKLQAGELVAIMGPAEAKPLMLACYRLALEAGAHPRMSVSFEETEVLFLRHASEDQLSHLDPVRKFEADNIAAAIRIRAPDNTRTLSGSDPARVGAMMTAARPVMNQIIENVRWDAESFVRQLVASRGGYVRDVKFPDDPVILSYQVAQIFQGNPPVQQKLLEQPTFDRLWDELDLLKNARKQVERRRPRGPGAGFSSN